MDVYIYSTVRAPFPRAHLLPATYALSLVTYIMDMYVLSYIYIHIIMLRLLPPMPGVAIIIAMIICLYFYVDHRHIDVDNFTCQGRVAGLPLAQNDKKM